MSACCSSLDRSGAVGVDLVDEDDPRIVHTAHFEISQELRERIREAAEPALLNLLSTIA